jgi:hypothetical protein
MDRNETWGEAFLLAIGFMVVLFGSIGVSFGAPAAPTTALNKLGIFFLGVLIAAFGIFLMWLSLHVQGRRMERERALYWNPRLRYSIYGL